MKRWISIIIENKILSSFEIQKLNFRLFRKFNDIDYLDYQDEIENSTLLDYHTQYTTTYHIKKYLETLTILGQNYKVLRIK